MVEEHKKKTAREIANETVSELSKKYNVKKPKVILVSTEDIRKEHEEMKKLREECIVDKKDRELRKACKKLIKEEPVVVEPSYAALFERPNLIAVNELFDELLKEKEEKTGTGISNLIAAKDLRSQWVDYLKAVTAHEWWHYYQYVTKGKYDLFSKERITSSFLLKVERRARDFACDYVDEVSTVMSFWQEDFLEERKKREQ